MYVSVYMYLCVDLCRGWFQRGWFQTTCDCKWRLYYNSAVSHVDSSDIQYFETNPYETAPYASPESPMSARHGISYIFVRLGPLNIVLRGLSYSSL